MRINNWKHVPWIVFVLLATIAAGILYAGNFHPASLPAWLRLPPSLIQTATEHHTVGGTPLGLWFGSISLAIFIFAILLSLRKKIPLWRVGTVQRWLRAHIWLTILTIPLVILHSGFQLGGAMTTLLIALYAVVMISGFYGLYLQHLIPTLMTERLPTETIYEQIPFIGAQLAAAAEKMRDSFQAASANNSIAAPAAPGADPASESVLTGLIEGQVLPYLRAHRGDRMRLNNPRFSEDTFRFVKLRLAEPYRRRVEEIQNWCDERRMLDLQVRLHHWLHGWLFVHVPFSFLLVMLTIWHACVTLFYY